MQDSFLFIIQQVLPDIVLSLVGIAVLVAAPYVSKAHRSTLGLMALAGVVLTAILTVNLVGNDGSYFYGMVLVDNFSVFFRCLFLLIAGLTILTSLSYWEAKNQQLAEYHALILFATVGMNLMVASNELIMVFLGLETLSISAYVLLGIQRAAPKSNEAALKYFLLGSFSSAFLLYGIALLYGATGSANLDVISRVASSSTPDERMIYSALGMLLVGLGFKVGAVPFHGWTPDVYEGAPTPVTAFMSAGPKAAGFAVLLRILFGALPTHYEKWVILVWVSAVLTMTLGNVAALVQGNIKRMLAYSSIAHAGYILVGFAAGNEQGFAAVLFYALSYALMNLGAFTIVALLEKEGEGKTEIDDYAGLGFRHPGLGAALSVCMLSLAGIPLTAGFAGKFLIFRAAVESHLVWLTILGVLNSAVSVYYYFRVVVTMYMKEPAEASVPIQVTPSALAVLWVTIFGIIQLGIYPNLLISLSQKSILPFR